MTITTPRHEGTVPVHGKRVFGVAEFGPASAEQTVLWFHGTPGARRQIPENARQYADEHGIRIIGMDRPGVGLSTAHRYRRLLDFSDDLAAALDHLGVDRFSVVALSGGAPYALAAAYAFPDRVPTLGILGGVVPSGGDDGVHGGLVGFANRFRPFLPLMAEPAGAFLTAFVRVARPVGPFVLDLYAKIAAPPGDQEVLAHPEHKEMFLDDLGNNGAHSMRAVFYDSIQFTRDWGFSVRDVPARIVWWAGDEDNIVPLAHAQHIVPLLQRGELRVMRGGGHLSALGIGVEVLEAVLDWS
jgi:pimeloyl-ACP methyl ester carboxylesterase